MQDDWKKKFKEKTKFFPRNNTPPKITKTVPCNKRPPEIGDIFHLKLYTEDGLDLKNGANSRNKFIIVSAFTPKGVIVGIVLINSRIGISEDEQYPLTKDKYTFLSHTSYVDCSSLFEIDNERLLLASYKGNIHDEDMSLILETIANSQHITPKQKKRFGLM